MVQLQSIVISNTMGNPIHTHYRDGSNSKNDCKVCKANTNINRAIPQRPNGKD